MGVFATKLGPLFIWQGLVLLSAIPASALPPSPGLEQAATMLHGWDVVGAEQALAAANRSYAEGKATYLEVLETQRALAETRIEYARTLLAHSVARTKLERAVGGALSEKK